MSSDKTVSKPIWERQLMDYLLETNRCTMSIRQIVRRLNKLLRRDAVEVISGHPTLIRIRGVARKVIIALMADFLKPRGSAIIIRRRGKAGVWLVRPSANRPLITI